MIDTGAGVIDADYRGEVKVLLFNLSQTDFEGEPSLHGAWPGRAIFFLSPHWFFVCHVFARGVLNLACSACIRVEQRKIGLTRSVARSQSSRATASLSSSSSGSSRRAYRKSRASPRQSAVRAGSARPAGLELSVLLRRNRCRFLNRRTGAKRREIPKSSLFALHRVVPSRGNRPGSARRIEKVRASRARSRGSKIEKFACGRVRLRSHHQHQLQTGAARRTAGGLLNTMQARKPQSNGASGGSGGGGGFSVDNLLRLSPLSLLPASTVRWS